MYCVCAMQQVLCFWGDSPPSGPGPPHSRDFYITQRRTTVSRTPLDVISSSHRPLPNNTQHPQQISMHPAGFEPAIP